MKLHWRMWQSLAAKEATARGRHTGAKPLPAKVVKAAKKKLRNPHTDGPHSSN